MPRTERERLAAIAAVAAICAAALVLPRMPALFTVPATILLVLLLPGLALVQALFPSRFLDRAEQAFFTIGLSISSSITAGLALNLLPVGMTPSGWGALLGAITVAALGIAWLRLGSSDRALMPYRLPAVPRTALVMAGLAAALVVGSLMVSRMGEAAQPRDGFTQLWMLPDANGEAIRLGIGNHENVAEHYDLRVTAAGATLAKWPDVPLADGQSWEQTVVLPNLPAGTNAIDATLYRAGDATPYRETHVEVTGRPSPSASPAAPSPRPSPRATP